MGWFQRNMTGVVGVCLIATLLFIHFDGRAQPGPSGPTVVDGRTVGKVMRVAFAKSHAAALRAAAAEIEQPGSEMPKILAGTQKSWADARHEAWAQSAQPALDELIPPGTTAPTSGQRARYAAFLRDVATAEEEVR